MLIEKSRQFTLELGRIMWISEEGISPKFECPKNLVELKKFALKKVLRFVKLVVINFIS
jgi:hypothetical protein